MIQEFTEQYELEREMIFAKTNKQHIKYLIAKLKLWRIKRKWK